MSAYGSHRADSPMVGSRQVSSDPAYSHEINHSCTDCPCCILFVACIAAWCGCYGYGHINGNPAKMFHGINGTNGVCGVSPGVENAPLLYWCADWANGMPSVTGQSTGTFPSLSDASMPVCVPSCPGSSNATSAQDVALQSVPQCSVYGAGQIIGYKTINFMDRYCLPNVQAYPQLEKNMGNLTSGQLGSRAAQAMESFSSLQNAWPVLVLSFFVAVVSGYLFLLFLKCCAKPIMYVTIFICIAGFVALGWYLWVNAASLRDSAAESQQIPAEATDHIELTSKVTAVVAWVISGCLLLLLVCFCSSINTAAACTSAACNAIWDMPALLLAPLVKAIVKGVFFIVIVYGLILVWTTADPVTAGDGVSRKFQHTNEERGIILFYLFGSFWILAFLNALYQFVVAYMVATYYYTPIDGKDGNKRVACCAPMCEALHLGLIVHAGSIAFGSMLVALLQTIQKVLEYAEKKSKEGGAPAVVTCIIACFMCCVSCCKETLQMVNKNAYIDIAVTGKSFCDAIQDAMKVIAEEAGAMAILNGATWVFTVFGTLLIAIICGGTSYYIVNGDHFSDMTNTQNYVADPSAVLVASIVIGGITALAFMHVFDMASDTLIFMVGFDRRSGKNYREYAPYPLQDLLDDHEHAPYGSHH